MAEDEEHIAKLITFKLSREGFQVTVAPNGQVALDRLREPREWRLLILDVMMPVKDGWTVLKELRADPARATLPVLMLTAKGLQKDAAISSELGANRYLKKPFDPDELARVVREMTGVA